MRLFNSTLVFRRGSKLTIVMILWLLNLSTAEAQRFFSVVFEKLPQDFQLYPRDKNNQAAIPISGIVEAAGWNYMSIVITRNNAPFQYLRANLQYKTGSNIGTFATETKIKAELAGYDFKVYVCKAADSVLVVQRKDVVSGDVYLLSGQSNSTGFFTEPDTSRFCRTFGRITDNLNTNPYNPADTLWAYSNQHLFFNGVGTMGLEIQRQLAQQSGVPNCLINGGFHWSSAFDHAKRNPDNPADLSTGYGRMLYRAQRAGVADAVKAFIFRQGETEAYHEGFNWQDNFDKLRKNLKQDFKGLQKLYVYQIDIIFYPSPVGAELRDYQRRLSDVYPDVTTLATVGTAEFDGLHYGKAGYRQNGEELSRIMLKDLYGSEDTANIHSPSLKKVFYKNEEKKQLVLVFDEGQELVYPETYRTPSGASLQMKDFFYLDGYSGRISAGKAEGNRIQLELTGSQNASRIDYLPMFVQEGGPYYPFTGPYIKNTRGMRAMTFYGVTIGTGLKATTLTAEKQGDNQVHLSWQPVTGAANYELERRYADQPAFTSIATLDSVTLQFTDTPDAAEKIHYRIKATSKSAESVEYATAEIAMPVILGVEPAQSPLFSVYPNPAVQAQGVNVKFSSTVSGEVTLLNLRGQALLEKTIRNEDQTTITLPRGVKGIHLIRMKSGGREWTKKIMVD